MTFVMFYPFLSHCLLKRREASLYIHLTENRCNVGIYRKTVPIT
ncbi:MAG: hypothetical protein UZ08_BCD001000506 [Candidatus Parvibacillus calidus]|jgi:hypothetical protein|nr:MAG: hypothetical protein UZ08_BCD001000506 [Candidatus Parvibacillus calidus]